MPKFSRQSTDHLTTCHEILIALFDQVVRDFDCTILGGHRNETTQNKLYLQKKTHVRFPNSKHNRTPSEAVDVAPYPINWNDRERFYMFGGYVLGIARFLDINLRWGGDWNHNKILSDNTFDDLVHFELINGGKLND